MKHTRNLSGFLGQLIQDERLLPSHISMYVSLFSLWSLNRFQNPFRICRKEIMRLSKIKSLATYHKCIGELHSAGLIVYSPSYDPYKGSLIEIIDSEYREGFRSAEFQEGKLSRQKETCFSIPKLNEVKLYFNERDLATSEAESFYSFYESQDWKLSNKNLMTCWQAAARIWIAKMKNMNV